MGFFFCLFCMVAIANPCHCKPMFCIYFFETKYYLFLSFELNPGGFLSLYLKNIKNCIIPFLLGFQRFQIKTAIDMCPPFLQTPFKAVSTRGQQLNQWGNRLISQTKIIRNLPFFFP